MTELIIIGTGGNAYDVLDIVESRDDWNVVGFLDDEKPIGEPLCGIKVLGRLDDAKSFQDGHRKFVIAIGSERSFRERDKLIASLGLSSEDFAKLIHPSATVSNRATLEHGAFVCAHACIGGNVFVGSHVIIGPGAIIGHDSHVGNCSILAPGSCVGGAVDIGKCCYLGARCVIRPRIRLADQTLIGMGAVVVRTTHEASVLVGNPARPLVRTVAPSI